MSVRKTVFEQAYTHKLSPAGGPYQRRRCKSLPRSLFTRGIALQGYMCRQTHNSLTKYVAADQV